MHKTTRFFVAALACAGLLLGTSACGKSPTAPSGSGSITATIMGDPIVSVPSGTTVPDGQPVPLSIHLNFGGALGEVVSVYACVSEEKDKVTGSCGAQAKAAGDFTNPYQTVLLDRHTTGAVERRWQYIQVVVMKGMMPWRSSDPQLPAANAPNVLDEHTLPYVLISPAT